jgi:3-dehydroquinate synthase
MRTLQVNLPNHSYPILIGRDLLKQGASLLKPYLAGRQVAIVSNTTVGPLYADPLTQQLQEAGLEVLQITLPDGEQFKTREYFDSIHDQLISARFERKSTLIAIGGGVVGDIAGYAAATFLRGIPFVQVPTTLLAQVDSSVGGKTGINHPLGKNLIGAFHQPRAVLTDLNTLNTLPKREFTAGIAEVLKYGFIRDGHFLSWLENHLEALIQREPEALAEAIYQSCRNKAEVVVADEKESGERALLNLGHTFGHAIEAGLGFGTWLHGEAVGAGIVMAAEVSAEAGLLETQARDRIERLVNQAGLPVRSPDLGFQRWIELMSSDKKVEGGQIKFVLLQAADRAIQGKEVPMHILQKCLASESRVIESKPIGT